MTHIAQQRYVAHDQSKYGRWDAVASVTPQSWADASQMHLGTYGRTHFLDLGDAKRSTVVLLHGIGSDWHSWAEVALKIAKDKRVVVFDIPGFGRSTHKAFRINVNDTVNQLDEALSSIVGDRAAVTLMGHSLGAQLSAHWASRKPARVEHLVPVSGPALGALKLFRDPASAIKESPSEVLSVLAMIAAGLVPFRRSVVQAGLRVDALATPMLSHFAHDISAIDPAAVDFAFSNLGNGEVFRTSVTGFGYDFQRVYSKISSRTTCVLGSADPIASSHDMDEFAQLVSAQEMVTIENVGHFVALERPDILADIAFS